MSGHRICWSASFFAFRFLVESYKVLRRHPNEQDSEWSLLRRIKETCRGHLKWLYHVQKQNSGQRFGANYWVSGKLMIKPGLSDSWVAENSLLDTGFQILKVAACMEIWDDKDIEFGFATDLMSEWAPSWLLLMENSDKRKKYAWPHTEKEGIKTFRLDEHIWIWRALKSLETMGDQALEKLPEKTRKSQPASRPDIDEQEDSGRSPALDWKVRLREIFPSDVVQRGISRRFTTENTILRKRMLATTRSIRESRFMLHARDTAIVYEEPFDFLGKDNSAKELWKTTVRYQMYHTEYQESNWEKTLRHALNIMLGARDLSINNSPPKKMIREATDILFRSSSPNGFFPGRIETSTNKPVAASCILEGDMESYYHASFEIPYILLTHMDQVRDAYKWRELEVPKSRRHSDSRLGGNFSLKASTPHDIGLVQCDAGQRQVLLRLSDLLLSRSTVSDLDTREVFPDVRRTSKKAVPFDGLVDSNNIVKLDDEWLYKYPDFFSRGKKLEIDDSDQGLTELKAKLHPRERDTYSGQFALNDNIKRNLQYCIVDIGSSKRDEGKRTERDPTYFKKPQNLENAINLSRTAQNSKKRLLSFVMVPKQVALHCYTTAEASERLNLKEFFRRHARYAKSLQDLCSTRLDKAREDLGFRSEQNIAMFTYVTVVFLPLGFAASIFSMSGPPETRVAINMVLASIVALVVTIVALMNAKMLGSVAENVSKKFEDLTEKRKRSSMILQGRKQLGNKVETSKIGDLNTDLVRAPSTVTGSWNLLFWTGYIFVEVPARTILAACRAIGWSPEDYEDGEGSEDSNDAESARAAGKKPAGEEHSPSPSVTQATHPPGQPGGGGYEHNKMVARVVLGLFTIPVFLVTWIIQILCLNAWDTLVLLGVWHGRRSIYGL
ncbi:hypothetical protein SLS64_010117 [Diaporthe eres]